MPGVKAKQHPDLNCAYAFSISPSIHDVLAELRDALESNGFTAAEAVALVREAERAFGSSGTTRQPSPYEQQLYFIVPLLCVREDGQLFDFESTFLLKHPWKLCAKDAALAAR